MKKILVIIAFVFNITSAQTNLKIDMLYKQKPLKIGQLYTIDSLGNSFKLSKFQFYLGDFESENSQKQHLFSSYFLIDLEKESSLYRELEGNLNDEKFIKFNLGVPSYISEKGIGEAELDPKYGMYWTWHTGYINIKIEGVLFKQKQSEEIILHLGGFQEPFKTIQALKIPLQNNFREKSIIVDIDLFIKKIQTLDRLKIMSPSLLSSELSKVLASCFR